MTHPGAAVQTEGTFQISGQRQAFTSSRCGIGRCAHVTKPHLLIGQAAERRALPALNYQLTTYAHTLMKKPWWYLG